MTDSFMGYKEDFEQCRDEAMEDIKAIADAKSSADRSECIERAENSVAEVERYLRILESESRAGDAQERRKMHQALRHVQVTARQAQVVFGEKQTHR
ncbi:hypothetical protein PINS_up001911 [Pythium insidiosum]|nr:hypothetical protein PINS_up001911 [Pythium insidiosum]